MYTGKIIDLDTISYYVLEETNYAGKNVVLLAPVNTNADQIDEDNLAIKEIVNNETGMEVKSLESPVEIDALTKLLLDKYSKKNED